MGCSFARAMTEKPERAGSAVLARRQRRRPVLNRPKKGEGCKKFKAFERPKKPAKTGYAKTLLAPPKREVQRRDQGRSFMAKKGMREVRCPRCNALLMMAQPIAESAWFEIKCRRCGLIYPSATECPNHETPSTPERLLKKEVHSGRIRQGK